MQARQLRSAATQASILGDRQGARDLLTRAAALDPSSPSLAYDLARAHEDLGDGDLAFREYCRAAALAPDGPDAPDARARAARLAPPSEEVVPADAADVFARGLGYFEMGRLNQAMLAFGEAIRLAPDWADAFYNRAVVYEALGQTQPAAEDFRTYLALQPEAEDRPIVERRVTVLYDPPNLYNPGGALAMGMLLPGLGHFATGRPLGGFVVFALAGGAAAAGLLIESVEVECLAVPVDGRCPPDQIRGDPTSDRPYLVAGLGGAAAITLIGAINAYRGARSRNAEAARAAPALAGLSLSTPSVQVGPSGARLTLLSLRF